MNHSLIEAFAEAFADTPRLAELEIRSSGIGTLRLRRSPQKTPKSAGVKPVATVAATIAPDATDPVYMPTGTVVESSLVGIFRISAKGSVAVGSIVLEGQPLGTVEVMRLQSEVPAPVAGELLTIFAQDGEPVEYGQPLFEIAPVSAKDTENA